MPGWYPDPAGAQGRFRYWNGSAWSSETTANPSDPAPGSGGNSRARGGSSGGNRTLLILGAIAIVAALIIAWFVVGNSRSTPWGDTPEDTNSSTPTVSGWDETSSPTPPPTQNASAIACPVTSNDDETRQGNDGRLHGGGISVQRVPGLAVGDQLRRHVLRGAGNSGALAIPLFEHGGYPEVGYPGDRVRGVLFGGEQHVVRLDIAVDDPLGVRGVQGVEDLRRDRSESAAAGGSDSRVISRSRSVPPGT